MRRIARTMGNINLCSNIKFHGYLIVVFSALLTVSVLISSVTLKLLYPNRQDVDIPNDCKSDERVLQYIFGL